MTTNEVLKSVLISFVDPDRPQFNNNNFSITLGDCLISEINQIKNPVLTATNSSSINFIEYEEIAISYYTIAWKFGDLNHSASRQSHG